MQDRPSELLADFRVLPNWRERAATYERVAQSAFWVTVLAVCALAALLGVYRFFVEWTPIRLIFTAEAVWMILLSIGGWTLTRTSVQQLAAFLSVAIVSVLLLLITVIVAPWLQADLQTGLRAHWLYTVISIVPLLANWTGTAVLLTRHCQQSIFCRGMALFRLRATFFGTMAGVLLLFQQLLAAVFAGIRLHVIPHEPLLYWQWFVTVVCVQAIAEEFIFRAAVFDYLHKVRGQSLWWAILVTFILNLLIYLPLTPSSLSPSQLTLYLLQPAMLSITCSMLWSWERGPSASLACNITLRLLFMLLW